MAWVSFLFWRIVLALKFLGPGVTHWWFQIPFGPSSFSLHVSCGEWVRAGPVAGRSESTVGVAANTFVLALHWIQCIYQECLKKGHMLVAEVHLHSTLFSDCHNCSFCIIARSENVSL
ncbi:hypothetical protein EV426DRAFT_206014 [Tirmania nivea]|nr:hypothetical protein EV426DRAFT_206014 [Tirmania nivea]